MCVCLRDMCLAELVLVSNIVVILPILSIDSHTQALWTRHRRGRRKSLRRYWWMPGGAVQGGGGVRALDSHPLHPLALVGTHCAIAFLCGYISVWIDSYYHDDMCNCFGIGNAACHWSPGLLLIVLRAHRGIVQGSVCASIRHLLLRGWLDGFHLSVHVVAISMCHFCFDIAISHMLSTGARDGV
jgi:hypothetical protein